MASKPSKREAERNQQELSALLQIPENTLCADCGDSKPKWASTSLGVFLCIRCAGLHRNMGREISTIKSVTSDIWTHREVEAMREMGNRKANAMYLATYKPNSRAPSNDTEVYRVIKDKYRDKLYMRDKDKKALEGRSGSKHAAANNRSASSSSGMANADVNIEADDHVTFAGQLKVLVSMGFTDTAKNLKALKRAKGGIDASVEILLSNPSPPEARGTPVEKNQRQPSATKNNASSKEAVSKTLESALQFMEGMGFSDQADNLAALKKAGGNVDQAVTILMSAPPKSTPTPAPVVTATQKPSTGGIGMDLLFLEDTPAQIPASVAHASDSPFGGFFGQPPVQQQQNAFNSISANNVQPFNPQAQFQQQQQMLPFQQSQPSQSQLQPTQLQFQLAQLQQNQLQQLQLQQLQQAQSQNPMQQVQQQQPNQQLQQQQNIQSQMWSTLSQPQQQPSQPPQPQPATMQPYSPFSSTTSAGPNYNLHITPNSGSIFLQKGNLPANNNNNSNGAPDPFSSLVKDSMRLQNLTPFTNSNSNAFGSNGAPMNQRMGQFQQQQQQQQQQQPVQQQKQQPGYSMYSTASQPAPFGGFTQSQVPRTMMDSPFNSQGMNAPGMQGMNMQLQQQLPQQQQQLNQQQHKQSNLFF